MEIALSKMPAVLDADGRVCYGLVTDRGILDVNAWLGKRITMRYQGRIHCVACGLKTSKSFHQGHCFRCFRTLASCDRCIMSPNLCHFHEGTCREPSWGQSHCMTDHVVYVAQTSHVKVGLTRQSQMPTRWLDQGAVQALPVVRTQNRRVAGLVEVAFGAYLSDRTHWQAMLKGEPERVSLAAVRDELQRQVPNLHEEGAFWLEEEAQIFNYPVRTYPTKVRSISLDKTPEWSGELWGVKGQYWMTDAGVFNVRKHGGYHVELELD